MTVTTHAEALTFLSEGRDPKSRTIANNTRVESRDGGDIAIRFHKTDVVTFHPDGRFTLDSGGWMTATTKGRMSEFSPANVWSDGDVWAVHTPRDRARFTDGMVIDADGSMQAHKARRFSEREQRGESPRTLRRRVKDYAEAFVAQFDEEFAVPGPGDCFGCLLKDKDGETAFGSDHLLSHMEESYFVPSLMMNAIVSRGYRDPVFIWKWWSSGQCHEDAVKTLSRYMRAQLGLVR